MDRVELALHHGTLNLSVDETYVDDDRVNAKGRPKYITLYTSFVPERDDINGPGQECWDINTVTIHPGDLAEHITYDWLTGLIDEEISCDCVDIITDYLHELFY